MIRGQDNLLAWVLYNDEPRWTIYPYQGQKTTYLAAANDADSASMDASIEALKNTLKWLAEGRYRVVCKGKETKGFLETVYEHGSPVAAIGQPSTTHVSGMDAEVNRRVTEQMEKFKLQHEMSELRKEMQVLKTGKKPKEPKAYEKRLEMFFDHLQHYVTPHLFSQLGINAPVPSNVHAISGAPETVANVEANTDKKDPQITPEDVARLQMAIAKGLAADSEFITVIEKIAEVAATDPEKYKMYKPFLMS